MRPPKTVSRWIFRHVFALLGLPALAASQFVLISYVSAQSDQTDSAAVPVTATITFPDNSSLSVSGPGGAFPLVAASAGQLINIQAQFDPATAGVGLIVQPLDGGTASGTQAVASDGSAIIQFQAGSSPGLYRVLLNQNGEISTLQFWVIDPENPTSGPPALQPSFQNQ